MTPFGIGGNMLEGYPFIQARNYTKGTNRTAIDWIVIHTMENPEKPGSARTVALWFASELSPQASAHYCVDNSEIVQCVAETDVAWHAPGANAKGIGIEHAGYAHFTDVDWDEADPQAMLALSARLTAELCDRWSIPVEKISADDLRVGKRGICGHVDVTDAFSNGVGHWDPGPAFPWGQYVTLVGQASENPEGG